MSQGSIFTIFHFCLSANYFYVENNMTSEFLWRCDNWAKWQDVHDNDVNDYHNNDNNNNNNNKNVDVDLLKMDIGQVMVTWLEWIQLQKQQQQQHQQQRQH